MCDRSEFANYWHLPELGGLELLNARYEEQAFTKHSHEGYCIAVIEDGAQTFQWQGSNYYANERHIVLINADEVHTGSPVQESGWEYHAILGIHKNQQTAHKLDLLAVNKGDHTCKELKSLNIEII